MESKAFLRLWSGSLWPADDFSLADNEADLAGHDDEHRRRLAFTYTVLAPDRGRCLGCVYINPLAPLVAAQPAGGAALPKVGEDAAAVRWWVTTPLLAADGDARLLETLIVWLREAWAWRRVIFHTPAALVQQTARYRDAGLRHRFDLEIAARGGRHECWG
jgi:hypothetical protein